MATVPDSAKAGIIDSRLEQISSDLLKLEKDMQKRMRSPLDRTAPIGDLSARIRDHEVRTAKKKTHKSLNVVFKLVRACETNVNLCLWII